MKVEGDGDGETEGQTAGGRNIRSGDQAEIKGGGWDRRGWVRCSDKCLDNLSYLPPCGGHGPREMNGPPRPSDSSSSWSSPQPHAPSSPQARPSQAPQKPPQITRHRQRVSRQGGVRSRQDEESGEEEGAGRRRDWRWRRPRRRCQGKVGLTTR